MADDKRSRSQHRAPDRPALTWPVWAEKYAPPTANSSADQSSKPVDDNVTRIRRLDVGLYGLCPRWDDCCLVVCNQCKQLIRVQALYGHYERRHSHYLTGNRHPQSSTHREAYKNTNTNGPYSLSSETLHQCERRDSSSGSSSYVRSSAKEMKVSSSRRKPSLSSQWDSDDSTSESHVENNSDSVSRYLGLCNRDHRRQSGGSNEDAKRRKTEVSLGLSETPKSIAKNSVQVNGIKVIASSELPRTVGAHNSHRSAPPADKSKSSKHAKRSSRGTSEASFSAEKPSDLHSKKSDSSRLSPVTSKTKDRCDSSYRNKSHVDNSHAFTACRTKDSSISSAKDRQGSASYSPKSDCLRVSSMSVKQNGEEKSKSSNSCESSNVRFDGSHRKSKRTTAVEMNLNHRQNCGTDSVSLPTVSRSSLSEECRHAPVSSKSTAILPSPKLNHDRPRVGTTITDTRLSDRSSVDRDSVSSFSNMSVHEPSKSNWNYLVEPSRSSSSKSASKTTPCSGSGQDLPHRTHQHHQPKSGSTNSGSLHSTEISKSKLDLKTGSKLGLEPTKLGDSFNGKTFPVEQQNIPPYRREHLSNNMSLVATDDAIIKHENPSLGEGPETMVRNCLSAKVPKLQDNLKSSAQFCKDHGFDPDRHCGVICADTGKPCTHSLTCKIHALSSRRSVAGRTKPLDQLLGERRLFKEALRKKRELQPKSKPLDETTAAPVEATSNVETRQNPPVFDDGLSPSQGSSVSCLPSLSSANQLFTRRPRPKPQFRTSLFRSSKWFSVLAPAVGSTEKQITRPAKLPLFHANGSIKLPDDAVTTANSDSSNVEVASGFSLHQNSSYLSRHPKPAAVNRFGAWKIGQGCSVFNRKEDFSRSIFEEMLDILHQPPPNKKLCVEAGLPVSVSGSGELSSSHNLHGFTREVVSTNVALPFASSSSSSAFLPLVHKHSSKARTQSHPISTASPAVTVVRSAGLNPARNSESSVAVYRNTPNEDARFSSPHNPLMSHRHSSLVNTAHNYIGSLAVKTDSQRLKIVPTPDQTGNGLNSTLAGPHLQNGQHPLAGSGKRRSHGNEIEDKWHANDSGKQKLQRSSEGSKFKTDESKTRTNNVVKENNTHLKDNTSRVMDWHSGNKILSSEAARPSVIAFGCPTSQKFAEISSHPASSLANLNGLQTNYRSLSNLNHKPQHNSNVVSKDRHLSSQSTLSSSSASLKNGTRVNRTTVEVPTR